MSGLIRKIVHIDMDAFYASVEQRDNPALVGKPIAVGGNRERGVVAAASYEARKYGVKSAMASSIAHQKCPHLIFVKPRFDAYKEASQQIRTIFEEYTHLVEPLSLDEAYLDVTENNFDIEFAMDVATQIKEKIKAKTGLTASAGISYNKFLAKIASDYNKPDGFYVITPRMSESFIEKLAIEKFFGVGKVTAKKMHLKGIFSGKDLKKKTETQLTRWFGKSGKYYFNSVRGIDLREVNPNRIRKSLGTERTFENDITTKEEIAESLEGIAGLLIQRIKNAGGAGKSLTLKVKYGDFKQITRSKTFPDLLTNEQIRSLALQLLELIPNIETGVRLIGLQTTNFNPDDKDTFLGQLELEL